MHERSDDVTQVENEKKQWIDLDDFHYTESRDFKDCSIEC